MRSWSLCSGRTNSGSSSGEGKQIKSDVIILYSCKGNQTTIGRCLRLLYSTGVVVGGVVIRGSVR